jgi:hypothetical protein
VSATHASPGLDASACRPCRSSELLKKSGEKVLGLPLSHDSLASARLSSRIRKGSMQARIPETGASPKLNIVILSQAIAI